MFDKKFIFTIGHSNRSLTDFTNLLQEFDIQQLVDIRSIPGSSKFPQFNKETLQDELKNMSVGYLWLENLGGRRKKRKQFDSPNTAWTSMSFRNYADYAMTGDFKTGLDSVMQLAIQLRTAIMCAEAVYWRCHRRIVSDYLIVNHFDVTHIIGHKSTMNHELTKEAILESSGTLIYPALA